MAPSVLLLDYDSRSIGQVRSALRNVGLEVRLALDGVSGIQEFHSRRPDLVLVQDLLPKKHGTEVCRDLKRTEAGRRTPVLLIAPKNHARRSDFLNTGCDGFVTKPIDQNLLLERVREHLRIDEPKTESKRQNTAAASRRLTPANASKTLDWIPLEIAGAIGEQDIDAALDTMGWGEAPKTETAAGTGKVAASGRKATRKRTTRKTKAKNTKKKSAKKAATRKKAGAPSAKKATATTTPKRKATKKKSTKKKTSKIVTKKAGDKKKAAKKKASKKTGPPTKTRSAR